METPKFRIRKLDEHNWIIEEHEPGGGEITRGRHVGKTKQERWKLKGYYSEMKFAAARLMDYELETGFTGTQLEAAIVAAEKRVMAAVEAAVAVRITDLEAQLAEAKTK